MLVGETYRKKYRLDSRWQQAREVAFLEKLSNYKGFPTVVEQQEGAILLTHCGGSVGKAVRGGLPVKQVEDQLVVLVATLVREGIRHRDITTFNLQWHPEWGLHLIDFGWSTWADEDDTPIHIPHVMRPWMCDLSDMEQVVETLKKLRAVEVPKQ